MSLIRCDALVIDSPREPFKPHVEPIERNAKGQFLSGHKASGPGRPKGSRNRLVPKDIAIGVDVTVTRALDAVQAFRMLQELPSRQLEDLRNADTAEH